MHRLSEFLRSDSAGGVFHGWWLVAIGILIILVGRDMGDGLIETAWARQAYDDEFGPPWSVAVGVAGAIAWWVSLWIAGWGVDRLGPRRMAQIGLPLVGLVALFAAIPVPGVLQVAVTGMFALGMLGAYLPAVAALNHWFRERLALALALMPAGVSVGGFVVKPIMAALLAVADWRLLTVVAGATILAVAWPLVRAIRDRPEDRGEHPDGLAPAPKASIPNHTWREAMRSRQFWTLAAAGACVAVASGISTVYDWQIISQGSAAIQTINSFGLFQEFASAAGILIGGLASCRFPVRYVLAGAAAVQTAGMALLLSGYGPILLESGILVGMASGMSAAPGIAAVGIYFGRRSFGMITVTGFVIDWIASSAGLPAAGYLGYLGVADGVYTVIFVAAAIVSLIGAGLYIALGQPRLSPSQRDEDPAVS